MGNMAHLNVCMSILGNLVALLGLFALWTDYRCLQLMRMRFV